MISKNIPPLLMMALLSAAAGCKHGSTPAPSGNNNGNNPPAVTDPLNPSFKSDILPIFQTYCAGCHNSTTAGDGYIFTSYETITAKKFVPGDPGKTKIYEAITEDNDADRMPQAPNPRLSDDRIQLIRNWILNGAPNN